MKEKIPLPLVIIFVLLAAVSLFAYFYKQRSPQQLTPVEVEPAGSPLSKIPAIESLQTYTDPTLKFSFKYPATDTLVPCQDIPCSSIPSWGLSVNPLYTSDINANDIDASLLKADLMCSADGPNGSISCKNTDVTSYANTAGVPVYVVARQKTFTGQTDVPAGTYPDAAYVFVLPKPVSNGTVSYAGVLFSVENPTADNLGRLKMVVDSFSFEN